MDINKLNTKLKHVSGRAKHYKQQEKELRLKLEKAQSELCFKRQVSTGKTIEQLLGREITDGDISQLTKLINDHKDVFFSDAYGE